VDVQQTLVVVSVAVGVPPSLARLWWLWWKSTCDGCGLVRSDCACTAGPGGDDHVMRPKR
jgi:hypothetical protein